jgi:hypothetical protein
MRPVGSISVMKEGERKENDGRREFNNDIL